MMLVEQHKRHNKVEMIRQTELYCKLTNEQCTWGWFIDPDKFSFNQYNALNKFRDFKNKPSNLKTIKSYSNIESCCDGMFEMELTVEESKLNRYIDKEVIIRGLYVFSMILYCCYLLFVSNYLQ